MIELIWFAVIILGAEGLLLLYVFHSAGWSVAGFKSHWNGKGKNALIGLKFAVVLPVVLILILLGIKEAGAGEWNKSTTVFAGLDYTPYVSGNCWKSNGYDKITSNLGLTHNFYSDGPLSITGGWTHHSCAIGRDNITYDGIGLKVNYTIEW